MFSLFYDKDDKLISERIARTLINKKGEESYNCYDSDITNEIQSENDFTKAFSPSRVVENPEITKHRINFGILNHSSVSKAMDLYKADSYMMDKRKFKFSKNNNEMYKITYLDE